MSARESALAGVRDLLPVLVSILPIAAVVTIAAVDAGLTAPQTLWMSIGIYNGLAQAAIIKLIDAGAAPSVILLAGILINLRFLMYSASIAPYFDRPALTERLSLAYLTVDTLYPISVGAFERERAYDRKA